MIYPVADIFRSLQGEGHFIGYPMTFVRLAGCSVVSCSIRSSCDEAPWRMRWKLDERDIVAQCQALARAGTVCVTGGEPTDHDLIPLLCALKDAGYRIHLETSGVRSVEGMPLDWITVSPKVTPLRQRTGHVLKVVVLPEWGDAAKAWDIVKGIADGTSFFHYYLQPLTNPDGTTNLPDVIAMLHDMHNGGGKWALSTQAHKEWGVK